MSDHGRHIAAILLGVFYVICPELVEAGFFHCVSPPYYALKPKGSKKKDEQPLYLRNAEHVAHWMINHVYREAFDVRVVSQRLPGLGQPPVTVLDRVLDPGQFEGFAKLVLHVGTEIDAVAEEFYLPGLIVEALAQVTRYLEIGAVQPALIQQVIGADHVQYDDNGHVLTVAYGLADYIIPLLNVRERLYEAVLPALHRLGWQPPSLLGGAALHHYQLYVTTRHTALYRDTPTTVYQLYERFRAFDDFFDTKSYKGLGSMMPKDKALTCMDPHFRSSFEVRGAGNPQVVFDLLGGASGPRKKLLTRPG